MGAGRGAAVGVVAKGVNVHAALGVGVVAGDVPGDGGGSRLGRLLEDDGARDLGVTADDRDWEVSALSQHVTDDTRGPSRDIGCRLRPSGLGPAVKLAQTCSASRSSDV